MQEGKQLKGSRQHEKDDGKAYVAVLNMEAMAQGLPPSTSEFVIGASNESLEIVKSVVGDF